MFNRTSLFLWSLPVGTWGGVRLRVSWLLPVTLVWLLSKFSLPVALVIAACLLLSVLLHEVGHVVAARRLGLQADEILLWPLGGLAAVEATSIPRVDFLVAAAGPLVNLVIVTLLLPVMALQSSAWPGILNPTVISVRGDLAARGFPLVELCEIAFSINWLLLLANLLPALPLDGGRMLRAWLSGRLPVSEAREWAFRIAVGVGVIISLVAMLFLESTVLMGLGMFILLGAILDWVQLQFGERPDDSFLGYDFSQGYTSLDRSVPRADAPGSGEAGAIRRWLDKRREVKRERIEQEQQAAEDQLDSLLEKVHLHGMHSLTAKEKQTLEQASQRIRSRSKPAS